MAERSRDELLEEISILRQRVKQLTEEGCRFNLMADNATEAVVIFQTGKPVFFNQRAYDITGYSPEDLGSILIDDLIHPQDLARLVENFGRRQAGELRPATTQARVIGKSGQVKRLDATTLAINWQGQPANLILFAGITSHKQAEEELAINRETLRAILRSAPVGIGLWRERRLVWANQTFVEMLGWSELEMVGCDARMFYTEQNEYERVGNLLYVPGGPVEVDTRFLRADGSKVSVRVRAADLDPAEPGKGQIITVADLSREEEADRQRAELEARLRQAQKMEALGVLAGGIAHDFNNILGAILGYTQLAQEDLDLKSEGRDNLEQALKAGERARDLVKHILAFSRRAEQEKRPVCLTPLIKETMHLMRASLPPQIELRHRLGTEEGLVLADATQLHQVLMNLCTNAAHAMQPGGGLLEVELEDVDLDKGHAAWVRASTNLRPGLYRKLTVRDTGRGMEPEIADRVFEPYFTTKSPGQGTGLGLAVVHGIVQSHEGAISVESTPGKGSAFQVWLPRIMDAQLPAQVNQGDLPGGRERLLFVDDEASLVEVARRMLERLGYEVDAFLSGVQALEAFSADPHGYDLVITDLSMPNMSGLHLTRKINQLRPETPVVLCTGFSQALQTDQPRELGLNGILMKPLMWRDLALAVRRVLDGGEAWPD
jgi:two-component system cell cycle sensor histidine kinase/response regulator CckA